MTDRADRRVAWIGLGSNLDDPAGHVRQAIAELRADTAWSVLACSSLYRSTPVGGPPGQPMFCNAALALALATTLTAHKLLDQLQAIEAAHGRVRDIRWGPRTLDLDILAIDAVELHTPRLRVPHPRAHERAFVLVPLAEIAPALSLGHKGRVVDRLAHVDRADIVAWCDHA